MIWLHALVTVIIGTVFVVDVLRDNKNPSPCDTCEHLTRKGKQRGYSFKYECSPHDNGFFPRYFDKPPEYCKYYKLRETERD